ncbi:MAG TPA: protein kinase, partial [Polyangiaceae bacterium]
MSGRGGESGGREDSFEALLRDVAHAPSIDPASFSREDDLTGRTLGRFRVLERLGRGGMGAVYRAYDERLERDVALKVLRRRGGEDTAAILREAQAAAAVRHRAIAQIHDVGEADGVAFLAMELVDGETLGAIVAREGPLPTHEVLRIAAAIAAGLARAHAAGIAHLDLKPENVMRDRDGEVRILDFGLARTAAAAREDAANGIVRGSPAYMAPEQARGEAAAARADVYSFGATLYELATGRLAPRAEPPSVEAPLGALVARCLAHDPGARFADGAALVTALAGLEEQARRRARRRTVTWIALGFAGALAASYGVVRFTRPPRLTPTTALHRLTANVPEVPILHAALAPEGERLAYADRAGVHVARLGTPEVSDVPLPDRGEPRLVAWSADARFLYVAVAPPAEGEDAPLSLARIALDTGAAERLGEGGFTGVAPSPDGTKLAFAETRRVGWMDAKGARHPLLEKPAGCSISELAWAPGGGRLAYTMLCYGTLGDAAVESVALDGSPPVRIVADPRLFTDASRAGLLWSPRGGVVYSLAEWLPAESGANLWSVPVDPKTGQSTGAPRPITAWVGMSASALSEDARGDRVAFVRSEIQADVYVGDLQDGGMRLSSPRRLTLSDRNERPSAWGPDGSVLFFSDRTGNFDVFAQPLDGGAPRAIAAEPDWETMPQVTPDGRAVLYWRFPPARAGEPVHPEIVRRELQAPSPTAVLASALGVSRPAGVGRPQPWEMRFRCPRVASAPCLLGIRDGDALVFDALDPLRGRGPEQFRIARTPSTTNV